MMLKQTAAFSFLKLCTTQNEELNIIAMGRTEPQEHSPRPSAYIFPKNNLFMEEHISLEIFILPQTNVQIIRIFVALNWC